MHDNIRVNLRNMEEKVSKGWVLMSLVILSVINVGGRFASYYMIEKPEIIIMDEQVLNDAKEYCDSTSNKNDKEIIKLLKVIAYE